MLVPAGWHVSGDTFIATNAQGHELWRYRYPAMLRESPMREHLDAVQFVDLEGNGGNEVLVNAAFAEPRLNNGSLICFSSTGQVLWRFDAGRVVRTRKETFPSPYSIEAVRLMPRMRDGRRFVVVSGHHGLYYPDQVVVLDPKGDLVKEYWHSGNLNRILFADFNQDGDPEILLGGVSNAWRAATLVGLRLRDVAGASQEENPDYQLLGFPPAHETVRLLFPRTDVNRECRPFNYITALTPLPDGLQVDVGEAPGPVPSLRYRLRRDFEVQAIEPLPPFPAIHDRMFAQHLLDHRFDLHRDLDLLRKIVYIRRP